MAFSLTVNETIADIAKGCATEEHVKYLNKTLDDAALLLTLSNEKFQFSFKRRKRITADEYQDQLFTRIKAIKNIEPLTVAKWAVILNQSKYLEGNSITREIANAVIPLINFYKKSGLYLSDSSLFQKDPQGHYPITRYAKYDIDDAKIEVRATQDIKDDDIGPLLHDAIESKNSELIKVLLDHNEIKKFITKVAQNPSKYPSLFVESINTLMHKAVQTNNPTIVNILLDAKIVPNKADKFNRYPLSYAAEKGNPEIFNRLFKLSQDGVNQPDTLGRTPLSYAAESGSNRIVKKLDPEHKKCFTERDFNNITPYNYAKAKKHEHITSFFDGKDDPVNEDDFDIISYENEIKSGFPHNYIQLKQHIDKKPSSEQEAAWREAHRVLSNDNHSINLPNKTVYQPIDSNKGLDSVNETDLTDAEEYALDAIFIRAHQAQASAQNARADLRGLQNNLKALNNKDDNGKTPLMVAAENNNIGVLEVLIAAGADPTIIDNDGKTADALFQDCQKAYSKSRQIMPAATPKNRLALAVKHGFPSVVETLLKEYPKLINEKEALLNAIPAQDNYFKDYMQIKNLLLDTAKLAQPTNPPSMIHSTKHKKLNDEPSLQQAAEENNRPLITKLMMRGEKFATDAIIPGRLHTRYHIDNLSNMLERKTSQYKDLINDTKGTNIDKARTLLNDYATDGEIKHHREDVNIIVNEIDQKAIVTIKELLESLSQIKLENEDRSLAPLITFIKNNLNNDSQLTTTPGQYL